VATMIGCLPTQAIAFEWKPGVMKTQRYFERAFVWFK